MLFGFFLTLPTVVFWVAVSISKFAGHPEFSDAMLFMGSVTHLAYTLLFPALGLLVAVLTRREIEIMESHSNLYRVESNNRRINNVLINWCVILLALLVVALLNDI